MSLARRVFTERRAVVLPLLVFLVANVGVLALVVWPMQRAADGAQDAKLLSIGGLVDARKLESQIKAERAGKERADVELQKFYAEILPGDFRDAVGVASFWLGRIAEESRVTFRAGQWDREAIRDSRLTKVTGQVTLVGDYANIRRFLYEVETAQEFVIIESVALSQGNATQADSLLELALTIATYYVTDPASGMVTR